MAMNDDKANADSADRKKVSDVDRAALTPVAWRGGGDKLQDGANIPLFVAETPGAVAAKATTNERRNLDTSGFAVVDAKGLPSDPTGMNSFSVSMGPAIEQARRDNKPGVTFHNVGGQKTPQTVYVVLDNRRLSEPTPVLKVERAKPEAGTPSPDQGIRLESLGKGLSTADVDDRTGQVVIRRSGRIAERFDDDRAITDFADRKKLSDVDRETLAKLAEVRRAEPAARAEVKLTLGPYAKTRELEPVNAIESDLDRTRVRAEVQQNDAEVYRWVERQRKLRAQQVQPAETAPIAAVSPDQAKRDDLKAPEPIGAAPKPTKGDDTVEKESTFSSPNARRPIPPELGSQFLQVGEKYFHPNNTKTAAFVDRGDRLETPSSAPKTAEMLVKIAESRGWEDLRVKGTEGFRREVWLEASVRGIHVDGYKPSELDKVELERRDTFMQDRNSIQVRSEAFQKLSPEDGARRDPTLANAYAVIQAAKAFAKERIPDRAQQAAFVESTQAKIIADLEAGRTTPTVNLRAAARTRDVTPPRDRDQRGDRER